jgi:hypothetical protein
MLQGSRVSCVDVRTLVFYVAPFLPELRSRP